MPGKAGLPPEKVAKALVELSEEKKAVDKIKADMGAFVAAVDSQPSMQKLFSSPVFTPENKKDVIKDLAGKLGMQQVTQRFVEHLAETGRIRYVKDVHEAFLAILAERQNRATVELTTAAAVNAAQNSLRSRKSSRRLRANRWISMRASMHR